MFCFRLFKLHLSDSFLPLLNQASTALVEQSKQDSNLVDSVVATVPHCLF